jgi:DNA-binding phage protein
MGAVFNTSGVKVLYTPPIPGERTAMKVKDALNSVIEGSGRTKYSVSRDLGRGRNYVYKMFDRDSNPAYETILSIANLCGYDLALVKRDGTNTILLDKPED